MQALIRTYPSLYLPPYSHELHSVLLHEYEWNSFNRKWTNITSVHRTLDNQHARIRTTDCHNADKIETFFLFVLFVHLLLNWVVCLWLCVVSRSTRPSRHRLIVQSSITTQRQHACMSWLRVNCAISRHLFRSTRKANRIKMTHARRALTQIQILRCLRGWQPNKWLVVVTRCVRIRNKPKKNKTTRIFPFHMTWRQVQFYI